MRTLLMILLTGAVMAAGAQTREVYVDNVVIVLDASGSMNDRMSGTSIRKIEAAKTAIREVLNNTPATTQVGLLVFGQERRWEYPLGPRNDTALIRALDGLYADGGTPLGEFIKKGADRLLEARRDQFGYGSYRLLIVTDGEASDGELVARYTPDVISRGIIVDVIGVDMRQDHTLANQVHSYRRANDPDSLSRAVREVFAEVGSGDDGLSGDAAFKELQGLPVEAAMAIIDSLAATGNEPIGASVQGRSMSGIQPQPFSGGNASQRGSSRKSNSPFGGAFVLVIIVVFGLQVVSKVLRKG